jgi:hypothetical protein
LKTSFGSLKIVARQGFVAEANLFSHDSSNRAATSRHPKFASSISYYTPGANACLIDSPGPRPAPLPRHEMPPASAHTTTPAAREQTA